MSLHPLSNFEIQKYYQNETRLNGVYLRDTLSNINGEAYVINIGENNEFGTHWIALYCWRSKVTRPQQLKNSVVSFDSFGVDHLPKGFMAFIRLQNIITNIFRVEAHDPIMWRYFFTRFVNYMLSGKTFWLIKQFIFVVWFLRE